MGRTAETPFHLPPVYPITDKRLSGKSSHLLIIRELIRGGATLVQVRDKETPVRELLADLRRCAELCERHRVVLIINDRCDLVRCCGAAGVHLGQEDLPPNAARSILSPGTILGFSTHSLAQVRQANALQVDYLGFGPVFATSTKADHSPVVGVAGLSRACRIAKRPIVAIGGIGLEQVREVLAAGADSAAVVSALMRTNNLAKRMEQLLRAAASP